MRLLLYSAVSYMRIQHVTCGVDGNERNCPRTPDTGWEQLRKQTCKRDAGVCSMIQQQYSVVVRSSFTHLPLCLASWIGTFYHQFFRSLLLLLLLGTVRTLTLTTTGGGTCSNWALLALVRVQHDRTRLKRVRTPVVVMTTN